MSFKHTSRSLPGIDHEQRLQSAVDRQRTHSQCRFQGPWGGSYAANLRLSMSRLREAQWMAIARAERLPPMPWSSLARMNDEDLRAIHAFVQSLGPKGEPAPLALKPGEPVTTPVIVFEPKAPSTVASDSRRPEPFTAVIPR